MPPASKRPTPARPSSNRPSSNRPPAGRSRSADERTAASLRQERLRAMQDLLIGEHQLACGHLHHLATDPDVDGLTDADRRKVVHGALDQYAAVAQKMLTILEKLLAAEAARISENPAPEHEEQPPSALEWDMLLRLASGLSESAAPMATPIAAHLAAPGPSATGARRTDKEIS